MSHLISTTLAPDYNNHDLTLLPYFLCKMEKMLLVIVLLVDALSLFLFGSSPYTAAITFISLQIGERMHWTRELEKLRKEEIAGPLEGVGRERKGSGFAHERKDSTSSWYADGR